MLLYLNSLLEKCGLTVLIQRRNFDQGKRWTNRKTSLAQNTDEIRRTVYVSDIDQQVWKKFFCLLRSNLIKIYKQSALFVYLSAGYRGATCLSLSFLWPGTLNNLPTTLFYKL